MTEFEITEINEITDDIFCNILYKRKLYNFNNKR